MGKFYPPGQYIDNGSNSQVANAPIGSKRYTVNTQVKDLTYLFLTGLSKSEYDTIMYHVGPKAWLESCEMYKVPGVEPHDAEKTNVGDTVHCWAGAASNMLAYTEWGAVSGFQNEDDIMDYFTACFLDVGYTSYAAINWFLTGTVNTAKLKEQGKKHKGFYPKVKVSDYAGEIKGSSPNDLAKALKKLGSGSAVSIDLGNSTVKKGTGTDSSGHVVTLWGMVYEVKLPPSMGWPADYLAWANNPVTYTHLFISDSDNSKPPSSAGGRSAPDQLLYCPIAWSGSTMYLSIRKDNWSLVTGFTWLDPCPSGFSLTSGYYVNQLAKPTISSMFAINDSTIRVTWGAVADAQGYLIEYSTSSNFSDSITRTVGASTTSYEISGLRADTEYYVRIKATDNRTGTNIVYFDSNFSSVWNRTTNRTPLDAPTGLRITATTGSTVSLEWNSVANASGYKIQYSDDQNFSHYSYPYDPYALDGIIFSTNSATITGIAPDVTYYFRVVAVGTGSYSDSRYSEENVSITTLSAPILTVMTTSPDAINVAWNAVVNAKNYVLQYATNSSFTTGLVTIDNLSSTSRQISGLSADTTYYFRVKAIGTGEYGNSDYSYVKQATATKQESSSILVTTMEDVVDPGDGLISLREAIAYAGTKGVGTTITFAASLYGQTLTLGGRELYIDKNITIDATGMNITIDANEESRVFYIAEGATVTLAGLTITKGTKYIGDVWGDDSYGGGICNLGTLTVTGCTISNSWDCGGIYNGFSGTLTVVNSTITDNFAYYSGGGIFNWGGTVTVLNSTISDNYGYRGGGGGIYSDGGTLTVVGCTIRNNEAGGGGGICCFGTSTTIIGTTIRNNEAFVGGGIDCEGGEMTLINCVIRNNEADSGGGIALCASMVADEATPVTWWDTNTGKGIETPSPVFGITANITNCIIKDNVATGLWGWIDYDCGFESGSGGGILNAACDGGSSNVTITDCTISGNSATKRGGGIYSSADMSNSDVTATLTNSAVYDNLANTSGRDTFGNIGSGTPGTSLTAVAARPKVTVDKTKTTLTSVTLSLTKADYEKMKSTGIEYVLTDDAGTILGSVYAAGFVAAANGKNYTAQVELNLGFVTKNKKIFVTTRNAENDAAFKAVSVKVTTAKYNDVTGLKLTKNSATLTSVTLQFNASSLKLETDRMEIVVSAGRAGNPDYYTETVAFIRGDAGWEVAPQPTTSGLKVTNIFTIIPANPGKPGGTKAYAVTIDGLDPGTKYTFTLRSSAMDSGGRVSEKAIKTTAATLKYPAPAKVTQPTAGTMTFRWEAPKLKNDTLPAGATVTYTIGLWDTKTKKFTGTVAANTLIEGLPGLTTNALTGVAKDNVIAVQQVIKFANGLEVKSAVKTLKVK